jgi:hypothetical protein
MTRADLGWPICLSPVAQLYPHAEHRSVRVVITPISKGDASYLANRPFTQSRLYVDKPEGSLHISAKSSRSLEL